MTSSYALTVSITNSDIKYYSNRAFLEKRFISIREESKDFHTDDLNELIDLNTALIRKLNIKIFIVNSHYLTWNFKVKHYLKQLLKNPHVKKLSIVLNSGAKEYTERINLNYLLSFLAGLIQNNNTLIEINLTLHQEGRKLINSIQDSTILLLLNSINKRLSDFKVSSFCYLLYPSINKYMRIYNNEGGIWNSFDNSINLSSPWSPMSHFPSTKNTDSNHNTPDKNEDSKYKTDNRILVAKIREDGLFDKNYSSRNSKKDSYCNIEDQIVDLILYRKNVILDFEEYNSNSSTDSHYISNNSILDSKKYINSLVLEGLIPNDAYRISKIKAEWREFNLEVTNLNSFVDILNKLHLFKVEVLNIKVIENKNSQFYFTNIIYNIFLLSKNCLNTINRINLLLAKRPDRAFTKKQNINDATRQERFKIYHKEIDLNFFNVNFIPKIYTEDSILYRDEVIGRFFYPLFWDYCFDYRNSIISHSSEKLADFTKPLNYIIEYDNLRDTILGKDIENKVDFSDNMKIIVVFIKHLYESSYQTTNTLNQNYISCIYDLNDIDCDLIYNKSYDRHSVIPYINFTFDDDLKINYSNFIQTCFEILNNNKFSININKKHDVIGKKKNINIYYSSYFKNEAKYIGMDVNEYNYSIDCKIHNMLLDEKLNICIDENKYLARKKRNTQKYIMHAHVCNASEYEINDTLGIYDYSCDECNSQHAKNDKDNDNISNSINRINEKNTINNNSMYIGYNLQDLRKNYLIDLRENVNKNFMTNVIKNNNNNKKDLNSKDCKNIKKFKKHLNFNNKNTNNSGKPCSKHVISTSGKPSIIIKEMSIIKKINKDNKDFLFLLLTLMIRNFNIRFYSLTVENVYIKEIVDMLYKYSSNVKINRLHIKTNIRDLNKQNIEKLYKLKSLVVIEYIVMSFDESLVYKYDSTNYESLHKMFMLVVELFKSNFIRVDKHCIEFNSNDSLSRFTNLIPTYLFLIIDCSNPSHYSKNSVPIISRSPTSRLTTLVVLEELFIYFTKNIYFDTIFIKFNSFLYETERKLIDCYLRLIKSFGNDSTCNTNNSSDTMRKTLIANRFLIKIDKDSKYLINYYQEIKMKRFILSLIEILKLKNTSEFPDVSMYNKNIIQFGNMNTDCIDYNNQGRKSGFKRLRVIINKNDIILDTNGIM